MKNILIRNLTARTIARLKARARRKGISLQREVRSILEREAKVMTPEEVRVFSLGWRKRLAGRKLLDSVELIREDRER